MTRAPLESPEAYREAFAAGLERLLGGGLGAFVLVLANALFDPALHRRLAPALAERYAFWHRHYREALAAGRAPGDPRADVEVFLRVALLGLEGLSPTRHRHAGPWELQLNHLRAFRPARAAARPVAGISAPFDPEGFHFARPSMQAERLWAGTLGARSVQLLYNKFPFAPGHLLLVPDAAAGRPQLLDDGAHRFAWSLAEDLGARLPGVGLAYNAYGAGASVNHLHFQLFLREAPLPVLDPRWQHMGGAQAYPTPCLVLEDPHAAWDCLAELHFRSTPYNLLYLPGRLLILPRRAQGTASLPAWSAGQAWYELCGGAVLFSRDDYDRLGPEDLEGLLARLRPEAESWSRVCNRSGL